MKIWIHPYTLTPYKKPNAQSSAQPRKGALLKVQWSLNQIGFSDLFPWPEFGDPNLNEILSLLSEGDFSHALLEKSLWRNSVDGWARSRGRSLFLGLAMPESHGLLFPMDGEKELDVLRELGFSTFKLKMHGDVKKDSQLLSALAHAISPNEKIRLDFSGSLTREEFTEFYQNTKHLFRFIDLIEDPWTPSRKDYENSKLPADASMKLASDFYYSSEWPHQVIKTARATLPLERVRDFRVISTHSMDHPIGQAFSLWETAKFEKLQPHKKDIHGVSQSRNYLSSDFDWAWDGYMAKPKAPKGLGVGFDSILHSLKWERLL